MSKETSNLNGTCFKLLPFGPVSSSNVLNPTFHEPYKIKRGENSSLLPRFFPWN